MPINSTLELILTFHSRDIPIVLFAYFIWKFVKKTKIPSLKSIPLEDAFQQVDQYPDEPEGKSEGWVRVISWLWD